MCGLVALWGEADESLITSMLEIQKHRGPDGRGVREIGDNAAMLGHCRLAIIDPEGGRQPLTNRGGEWTLVANGMIYNDAELRHRHRGASFTTGSDSESILHAVIARGSDAVADLDGMFAFVMTNGERLIAARDPIGIKPLYMGRKGKALAFASEAKALAGVVDDVREFPAGHVFDSARGLSPYYALPDGKAGDWTLPAAVDALRDTLEAAVVKRLRSDVPFGSLLSGGLDSSIIAALAKRHVPDLKTFAVGLDGSPDLIAARRVAAYLGTEHCELVIRPDQVAEVMPKVLYHLESFDQDLVRSAVPCWFVAEFAAREVKVVLTGEGADELFAGYTYYRDYTDPVALGDELRRSIALMHNINLQRVDRMTMAHGLEARVPFLDTAMIELGLSLPVAWKLKAVDGVLVEKWILRKAFEDLLPEEIVWRRKLQFDEGSGFSDLLTEAARHRTAPKSARGGRSAEEAWYRSLLERSLKEPGPVLDLVSHWDTRTEANAA